MEENESFIDPSEFETNVPNEPQMNIKISIAIEIGFPKKRADRPC